jgi:hypothetical protein
MSSETNTVGGRKSSALDPEEKDFEQVVKNALSKKFDEWPNEAGVCRICSLTIWEDTNTKYSLRA